MAYSYGQLEQLWIDAGGSKAVAPLMAAIALAESGGNPGAVNATDNGGTQTSWGLWQISNGTHSWPGAADPLNAQANAKYAVAKYQAQGLGAWGTYTSGAYRQYYQGSTDPSALPPGGAGSSGAQDATLTSWWSNDVMLAPWQALYSAVNDVWGGISGVQKTASGLDSIAQSFNAAVGLFDRLLHAVEWLFVPSHWVRIISFGFGLMFLIPGLYCLMRAAGGSSGDVTLALGIMLLTIAGVLLFIAFHNLPSDVDSLTALLQWISASIREGKPAAAGTASTTSQVSTV